MVQITPSPYQHAEAFCLMRYQSKDGRIVEYVWNSRDGVTPFGIVARDGNTEIFHSQWTSDERRPHHLPQIGDRIFVTMTEAHALELAENLYERDSTGPLADLFRETFGTDRDAAIAKLTCQCRNQVDQGWPWTETVTAELQATFIQSR